MTARSLFLLVACLGGAQARHVVWSSEPGDIPTTAIPKHPRYQQPKPLDPEQAAMLKADRAAVKTNRPQSTKKAKAPVPEPEPVPKEPEPELEEHPDTHPHMALLQAAAKGNHTVMLDLLAAGADHHRVHKKSGMSSLHAAVLGRNPDVLRHLIDIGVNVDSQLHELDDQHYRRTTPLMWCVLHNWVEGTKILIDSGVNVNLDVDDLFDQHKHTAVDIAQENLSHQLMTMRVGREAQEILEMLKEHGGLHYSDIEKPEL